VEQILSILLTTTADIWREGQLSILRLKLGNSLIFPLDLPILNEHLLALDKPGGASAHAAIGNLS